MQKEETKPVPKSKLKRSTLKINEIIVENRQRLDLGDLDDLKESIKLHGLIQPVVVNQSRRLIAGGRRLEAHNQLGLESIDVVFIETLTEDEAYILELEENIRRKDQTWQEQCLHIQTIHLLKKKLAAKDSDDWGQRETAALLGIASKSVLYNSLEIAKLLRAELDANNQPLDSARYWKCDSLSEAWRLRLRDEENAINAELAKRAQAAAVPVEVFQEEQAALAEFEETASCPDALAEERERYYSNPLNPPGSFEEYWAEKTAWAEQKRVEVHISSRFHKGDSIEFMMSNPDRFDHIITDIPYGIDMAMLNQQNPHGGMVDIDTVAELHDVDYNLKLISDFFLAAYECTKDNAFVVTWCDQMLWQFMYDHAIRAGFAVQRWPITWVKTSACMNQCAGFNTTKDTEIAIVCRKKGATLCWQPQTSVITAGRDELCSDVGHPFAKPRAIWEFLAKLVSSEGQSILEPFMGRGSGVISMLDMKRNVFGCELDDAHYNAGLENVKRLHYLKINPNFQFK